MIPTKPWFAKRLLITVDVRISHYSKSIFLKEIYKFYEHQHQFLFLICIVSFSVQASLVSIALSQIPSCAWSINTKPVEFAKKVETVVTIVCTDTTGADNKVVNLSSFASAVRLKGPRLQQSQRVVKLMHRAGGFCKGKLRVVVVV